MNISTKQRLTHRYRKETCGCQEGWEVEEGRIGSLWLADANYYIYNNKGLGPAV